ncbi:MAG: ketopantoate reductase family protein [Rubrivivax sp.]|nr:ketopantoate reductase family protein [Rubrivivax sp.]
MTQPESPFRSTVVVGAGAVGGFFGAMLARAGHRVTLVGRAAQAEAVAARGLQLHLTTPAGPRVEAVRLAATTELSTVRDADLVLFCVKSPDTDAVAREMAPHVAAGTWVMSLQNGVDNAAAIARHVHGDGRVVVPTVVYVATAMPEPGVVKHFGRGDLVAGPLTAADAADAVHGAKLQALAAFFAGAGVPVRVSAEVMHELWMKLMVNCAYNAISALAQLPYGRMVGQAEIREVQRTVVEEVVAVARAEGQPMTLAAALEAMERIAVAMPGQYSSTAQDLARGKPTEIDHLNGHVARRGQALSVATPVNRTLHALVKLAEAARSAGPAAGLAAKP